MIITLDTMRSSNIIKAVLLWILFIAFCVGSGVVQCLKVNRFGASSENHTTYVRYPATEELNVSTVELENLEVENQTPTAGRNEIYGALDRQVVNCPQ